MNSPPVHWAVAWGRQYYLGAGTTLAVAVDDARHRLAQSTHPAAEALLLELEQAAVPMIFWDAYPPADCLGLVPLQLGEYLMVCATALFPEPMTPKMAS